MQFDPLRLERVTVEVDDAVVAPKDQLVAGDKKGHEMLGRNVFRVGVGHA